MTTGIFETAFRWIAYKKDRQHWKKERAWRHFHGTAKWLGYGQNWLNATTQYDIYADARLPWRRLR